MGMLVRFIKISFLTLLVVCVHQNMGVAQEPANKNPVADISDFLAVKKDMWWRYECVMPDGGVGKITRRIAKINSVDGDVFVKYAHFSKSADLPQSCIDRATSVAQREGKTLTKRQAVAECISNLSVLLPDELRISTDGVYRNTAHIMPYPFGDRSFSVDDATTVRQRVSILSEDELPAGACCDKAPECVMTARYSENLMLRVLGVYRVVRGLGIISSVIELSVGENTGKQSCRLIAVGTNSAKEAKGGK